MKTSWLQRIVIFFLLLIVVWISISGFNLYRLYHQPMTLDDSSSSVVRLDKSMSATSLAHTLKSQHLIQSERLFLALVRAENVAHRLKAGVYQVKPGETCLQFLHRVAAGDVIIESFQIIEGTMLRHVSENLKHAAYLNSTDTNWASIAGAHANAEGLLLADTYQYHAGSQSQELLVQAHTNLMKYLNDSWQNRSQDLPYKTAYELLIAASIIEKETAVSAEKRLIAGVIVNRLKKHMPLQMDPTVIYALGTAYTGKLTHENMHIDSPYNSYQYRGLPPTPIAMVGKEAIDAAAHPELTDYLYFVARGDGTHEFSVNYEQQKTAIKRFLRKNT